MRKPAAPPDPVATVEVVPFDSTDSFRFHLHFRSGRVLKDWHGYRTPAEANAAGEQRVAELERLGEILVFHRTAVRAFHPDGFEITIREVGHKEWLWRVQHQNRGEFFQEGKRTYEGGAKSAARRAATSLAGRLNPGDWAGA